jgi:hypothetical protein
MQSTAWLELFRLIPETDRDKLLLMTADGSEVFVSDIVRLEPEYVVIRGRVGGTSDTGIAFFIPYDRITFARFQKAVSEEKVYGLYGLKPPEVVRKAAEAEKATAAEGADAKPDGEAAGSPPTPSGGVDRTQLLERLRQRTQKVPHRRPRPGAPPGHGDNGAS